MKLRLQQCVSWLLFLCLSAPLALQAKEPVFAKVLPHHTLRFPQDRGAHPDFRTEWWYVTGWLTTSDNQTLGFQVTFFRSATLHDRDNPSQFAPQQLIIAHAAISDTTKGKLQHDQKIARAYPGIAEANVGDTNLKLHQWNLKREKNGIYQVHIPAREFDLTLSLQPTQAMLLQGDQGYSRKGPKPEQASYYYSEPHLAVSGSLQSGNKKITVNGQAWLDHEWSSTVLDPLAVGWDWTGINLDDGSALMAFRIRKKDGGILWQHASLRDAQGKLTHFADKEIRFTPLRIWTSPRTQARYPVTLQLQLGTSTWDLIPLQDDQELDARRTTGSVYWEGGIRVERDKKLVGKGYLEMTGYVKPLKL